MNLVNAKVLAADARARKYAVPAFNTNGADYDITRAALEAAQELRSPLIIQEYEPNSVYRGFDYFVHQVKFLGNELGITVPVAIHLDHGHSFESVLKAMKAGFTSVMIDASHDPLEKNIALTLKVLEAAHPLGVSVEAEIGYVQGNEPVSTKRIGRIPVLERPAAPAAKTTPAEAEEFAQRTGVDLLAVAVGTTHGVYARQSEIDFDLIRELRSRVKVPLVQHGTGGIALADLTRLKDAGMAKVNFGECFRYDYIRHFLAVTDDSEHLWHPWRIMRETKNRLKSGMMDIIHALGSDQKA